MNKEEKIGRRDNKMLSPEKLWKYVVTDYKMGRYSFKVIRANGDKQPTDSLKSRFQT